MSLLCSARIQLGPHVRWGPVDLAAFQRPPSELKGRESVPRIKCLCEYYPHSLHPGRFHPLAQLHTVHAVELHVCGHLGVSVLEHGDSGGRTVYSLQLHPLVQVPAFDTERVWCPAVGPMHGERVHHHPLLEGRRDGHLPTGPVQGPPACVGLAVEGHVGVVLRVEHRRADEAAQPWREVLRVHDEHVSSTRVGATRWLSPRTALGRGVDVVEVVVRGVVAQVLDGGGGARGKDGRGGVGQRVVGGHQVGQVGQAAESKGQPL
mmetsp:Transcript_32188/g.75585  ORF Transcript_32188/g.75585 Transcript_32188/m.75585 type:complete len:263 (-) Transcript_32188:493-1281(-)